MEKVVLVRMFTDRKQAERGMQILRDHNIDSLIKTDAEEGYTVTLEQTPFPYKLYVKRSNFERAAEVLEEQRI